MVGDNKSLFDQLQQEGASARTRYYERAILLLKRAVLLLIMTPHLVTTDNMLADVFTKSHVWEFPSIMCLQYRNNYKGNTYFPTFIQIMLYNTYLMGFPIQKMSHEGF